MTVLGCAVLLLAGTNLPVAVKRFTAFDVAIILSLLSVLDCSEVVVGLTSKLAVLAVVFVDWFVVETLSVTVAVG
ncbi:hypothetical protein STMU103694_09510 [Streptococcus mutans]